MKYKTNKTMVKVPQVPGLGGAPNKRTAKSGSGYSNTNIVYDVSATDYSEFPATEYYMKKYNVFPSSLKVDLEFNDDEFNNKLKSIKTDFYTESYLRMAYLTCKTLICFDEGKHEIFFYITPYKPYHDKTKISSYSINCLYNPEKTADEIYDIVFNKIFNIKPIEKKDEAVGFLNILVATQSGFDLAPVQIKCPEVDFNINYNSDFKTTHELIIKRLSDDKSKGLVLLHGLPGTGKTTYIRYLINKIEKKIIYIPSNMASVIADPNLIKFFILHSNSVLVVEDAENILMKRSANSSQAITNILNLTDGLLSDCTSIQVVATFNTDILNIDQALLRKGRLIAKYEFKPLQQDRVVKLCKKLGVKSKGDSLAEIYNANDEGFITDNKIGFNVQR